MCGGSVRGYIRGPRRAHARMSDFFGDVYGVKFPEVVMNQGPLPGEGGLPAPLHDTADGRINYNSTLLGNLTPYAYGEAAYISSDTSYLNFPHSIQKIVPELTLPIGEVDTHLTFSLSHSVDDSDVAFVMRLARTSSSCTTLAKRAFDRQRMNMTVDPFINLCTLNYILAGIQVCLTPGTNSAWFSLLHDLDRKRFSEPDASRPPRFDDLVHIVQHLITPFGVVRGSEKQGGQDQVGYGAATWPVCFIANMVLDGKERNVCNLWTHLNVSAGADVVLRLHPCELPRGSGYTLNHYYKHITRASINKPKPNADGRQPNHVWQLVPDVFDLDMHTDVVDPYTGNLKSNIILPDNFDQPTLRVRCLDPLQPSTTPVKKISWREWTWQDTGYWHIGRTQVMMGALTPSSQMHYYNDLHLQMRPPHMEMTFQPVWDKTPYTPPFSSADGAVVPVSAGDSSSPDSSAYRAAAAGVLSDVQRETVTDDGRATGVHGFGGRIGNGRMQRPRFDVGPEHATGVHGFGGRIGNGRMRTVTELPKYGFLTDLMDAGNGLAGGGPIPDAALPTGGDLDMPTVTAHAMGGGGGTVAAAPAVGADNGGVAPSEGAARKRPKKASAGAQG